MRSHSGARPARAVAVVATATNAARQAIFTTSTRLIASKSALDVSGVERSAPVTASTARPTCVNDRTAAVTPVPTTTRRRPPAARAAVAMLAAKRAARPRPCRAPARTTAGPSRRGRRRTRRRRWLARRGSGAAGAVARPRPRMRRSRRRRRPSTCRRNSAVGGCGSARGRGGDHGSPLEREGVYWSQAVSSTALTSAVAGDDTAAGGHRAGAGRRRPVPVRRAGRAPGRGGHLFAVHDGHPPDGHQRRCRGRRQPARRPGPVSCQVASATAPSSTSSRLKRTARFRCRRMVISASGRVLRTARR
jgi:hypothetical protein